MPRPSTPGAGRLGRAHHRRLRALDDHAHTAVLLEERAAHGHARVVQHGHAEASGLVDPHLLEHHRARALHEKAVARSRHGEPSHLRAGGPRARDRDGTSLRASAHHLGPRGTPAPQPDRLAHDQHVFPVAPAAHAALPGGLPPASPGASLPQASSDSSAERAHPRLLSDTLPPGGMHASLSAPACPCCPDSSCTSGAMPPRSSAGSRPRSARATARRPQSELDEGLRKAVLDLCEVLSIEPTPDQSAALGTMNVEALSALREQIKRTRRWE
jgi:hypothetical protein